MYVKTKMRGFQRLLILHKYRKYGNPRLNPTVGRAFLSESQGKDLFQISKN